MQHVESTLGSIGQKCNSRRVDKINKNYTGLAAFTRKLGESLDLQICGLKLIQYRCGAFLFRRSTRCPPSLSNRNPPCLEKRLHITCRKDPGHIPSLTQESLPITRNPSFRGIPQESTGFVATEAPPYNRQAIFPLQFGGS